MLLAIEITLSRDDVQVRRHLGLLDVRNMKHPRTTTGVLPASAVESSLSFLDVVARMGTPDVGLNNHLTRVSPTVSFAFRDKLAKTLLDLKELAASGQCSVMFVKNGKERHVKVKHTLQVTITHPSVPRVRVYPVNQA